MQNSGLVEIFSHSKKHSKEPDKMDCPQHPRIINLRKFTINIEKNPKIIYDNVR